MKKLIKLILTTLFYGYAVIIDAPYRVVDGDYYVTTLVVIIVLLDICSSLQDRRLKEIDKLTESIEKKLEELAK